MKKYIKSGWEFTHELDYHKGDTFYYYVNDFDGDYELKVKVIDVTPDYLVLRDEYGTKHYFTDDELDLLSKEPTHRTGRQTVLRGSRTINATFGMLKYNRDEIFEYLDDLVQRGKARFENLVNSVKSHFNMAREDARFFTKTWLSNTRYRNNVVMAGKTFRKPNRYISSAEKYYQEWDRDLAESIKKDPPPKYRSDGTPYPRGHWDVYFGETFSDEWGDIISEKLKGKKISKRSNWGYRPGGLEYEADQLGMDDLYELLEALEGMCYEGRAEEIDDSTYLVL